MLAELIPRDPAAAHNDKASVPIQSERRLWQLPKKNVPLPIDVQPSTERGTRIVLLTCGTSRERLALPAPTGDS
jgi:hypothetical protein